MTIDPLRTLAPPLGLVSQANVYLPNEAGLWRTVAVLANGRSGGNGFASAVGAFDVKRRASMTRGAGEAVERFALVPTAVDAEHLWARHDGPEDRIDFATAGLGHSLALGFDLPWYRATDLGTGMKTLVPAPVVDYSPGSVGDPTPWDRFFDPSPNGAASGPSEHFAQVSGITEVMERDAFLSAWRDRVPLHSLDPAAMPAVVRESPEGRNFLLLVASARAAGIEPILAFVPHRGKPLETAVCIIMGRAGDGTFGAVGIKAAADPVDALRGALQEGLQIRELFLSRSPAALPSTDVTDDESRAAYWATEPAVAELRSWVHSFQPSSFPESGPTPTVSHLVKHLARQGIHSHWVSLTHRLPAAIREMGWVAGKAVCPGTVPLTMDETKALTVDMPSTPHPLI
jgi:ribosomal protein S12 methylthiotransferase accessory factor